MGQVPERENEPSGRASPVAGSRWFVAGLLFVVLWGGALFFRPLIAGETFFVRDFLTYDRPLMLLQARLAEETRGLPEWNPYLSEGQPFADRPITSPFTPFGWLLLVLPFHIAFVLQVVLPRLVSLACMFFLLRTLGRSREAALFGACVWGFGGFMLSLADLFPLSRTVAFIPLVLAFAVRVWRRPRPFDVLGLAAAFALACAGGEPTALLACLPLTLAAVLAVALEERGSSRDRPACRRGRRALGLAGGLLLGLVIAAAVLLPAAHLASMTVRADALGEEQLAPWSLAPPRLLEPILPHLLGNGDLTAPAYWASGWYPGKGFPYVFSLYAGLLTAVLALVAAVRRRREALPWLAAAAVGLVAAIGVHWPQWYTLRELLPALLRMRFPEKWVLLPALALIVLAALGFDRLAAGDRSFRRRTVAVLAGLAVVLVTATAWIAVAAPSWAPAWTTALGIPAGGAHAFLSSLPRNLLRQALVAAVALGLVVGLAGRRTPLASSLIVLTAVDLFLVTRPLLPTKPLAEVQRPPSFLAPLAAEAHPPRLFHLAAWQPACDGRPDIAEPLEPVTWGVPLAFEVDFDLTEMRWTHDATELFLAMTRRFPDMMRPLLARRSVGEVARCTVGEAAAPSAPVALERVSGALDPVVCVDRLARVAGAEGWADAVLRLGPTAASTALVDAGETASLPATPSPCTASVLRRTPRRLVARVNGLGPSPSFLAVNQTWHPAWRARLDGRPVTLLRTDLSLSGLLVPPGDHLLQMTFADPWVSRSAWLSLAGLLLWVTGVALACRHRD